MACTPTLPAQTAPAVPGARMWGGRFSAGPAPEMDRLNRSLPVDRRLWRQDVAGSRARAAALRAPRVIDPPQAADLRALLDAELRDLQAALTEQAQKHVDTVMPAYTHMQRAQPVSAAHWLMSHAWPLARDRERLAQARERTAVLPLGSGAIAGCPFPVDRVILKETLGFHAVSAN